MFYRTSLIWFRFLRRKTNPWITVAIATGKIVWLCGVERDREIVRFMTALTRIELVHYLELTNDLIDDLPYWFFF